MFPVVRINACEIWACLRVAEGLHVQPPAAIVGCEYASDGEYPCA